FNTRGDLTLINNDTGQNAADFVYDDIAIFPGCLTLADINTIAAADKPLAEIDQSLLSVAYSDYFPLNGTDEKLPSYTNLLRALNVFNHYQQNYGVDASQFAAILNQITPYALAPEVPFFDQVFNSPSLFEEPFAITNKDFNYTAQTGNDGRIVRQICAGLGINEAQFLVLASAVAEQQGDVSNHKLNCSLDVISAFYRLVMVPRWLGLSFNDGMALLKLVENGGALQKLADVPVYAVQDENGQPTSSDILDTLMALADAAQWLQDNSLSALKVLAMIQEESDITLPATTAELNFVNDINQQLPATLLGESLFEASGVPQPGLNDATIMSELSDLLDAQGLVLPITPAEGETLPETIRTRVNADIADWVLTDVSSEQVADIITNLIYQASLSQSNIANSALARALKTDHSLPPFLLQWVGSSDYDLLNQSLAMKDITSPDEITPDYLQLLYQLAQRAGIVNTFGLTPAMLNSFLQHPTWFGVEDATLSFTLTYLFSRYADWLKLTPKEDAVLAYLRWVNADSTPATDKAASVLAELLDWDSSEVQQAAAHAADNGLAQTLPQVDTVMRLQTLCDNSGVAVNSVIATGELLTSSSYEQWQDIGESLVAAQTDS
ncbi:hypothetical protein DOJ06_23895, partial [Salmonella enterica subsp. enterica serovar Bareilly]|nr:hypothetical protein [Salmonella enterica subsp. enterica serovar Bareilly]